MNESLYTQLTQAAFVLTNRQKNKAKIAELKNSIEKKKKQENEKYLPPLPLSPHIFSYSPPFESKHLF